MRSIYGEIVRKNLFFVVQNLRVTRSAASRMMAAAGLYCVLILALIAVVMTSSESDTFLWGVATAAYQTEGL